MLSRAELLRGRSPQRESVLRPPPALPEEAFQEACESCGKCIDACPEHILIADRDGRVQLDPKRGACTFCASCADACPTGALNVDEARSWTVKAEISPRCLSFNGITCRTCEEACDEQAIRFRLMTEGRSFPIVDEARCTGCGACLHVCPNQSVDLVSNLREETTA